MKKIISVFVCVILYACGSDDNSDGTTNNNITPNPPSLITPSNNATIITQVINEEVYFEWTRAIDPDNDIVGYRIWIDSDDSFNNPFHHFTETTNTTSYLQPNNWYYWRISTRDSSGNISDYSQTWSFYLQDGLAPTPPTLVFPLNETECSNADLTFQWNPSTDLSGYSVTYNLYISDNPDFTGVYNIYSTPNTEYHLALPGGTALYWYVEATNGSNSSVSEKRSLYTQGDGTSNTIPQLEYTYPEDEAIISDLSPLLQWQANDNETSGDNLSYKVYFSEVGQDLELIYEGLDISSYEVTGLNIDTSYQWSIWVTDTDGATNIGNIWVFNVQ